MDLQQFSSVDFGNTLQTVQNDPTLQQKNNSEMVNEMYKNEEEKQKLQEKLKDYKEAFAQLKDAYKKQEKENMARTNKSDMYKSLLYGIYVAIGLLIASVISCFWAEYQTTLNKQNQYLLKAVTIIALIFISSVVKNMI